MVKARVWDESLTRTSWFDFALRVLLNYLILDSVGVRIQGIISRGGFERPLLGEVPCHQRVVRLGFCF